MPTPKPSSCLSRRHLLDNSDRRRRIATAIRTARAHGSGQGIGSPKTTMIPSPTNLSSVPSNSWMIVPNVAWYSRITAITSSGSAISAKAVNPRRSQKTIVTCLRWLAKASSGEEERISSAICGERKRFKRVTRSICASCSTTRCSSVLFHDASSAACVSTRSCNSLIRSMERTRATSAAWSMGLVRYSSAPALSPVTTSCESVRAVTMMIGTNPNVESPFNRRQTSKPSIFGIMTSSRTTSGATSRATASALSPFSASVVS